MPTCLPVYLSTCLPADHVHVEILIYKTFNVPTCLPVHLSTCPPCTCKSQNMYLQNFQCADLSTCLPVHLSTCLPVHHVHVKLKKNVFTILFMCLRVDQRRIFVLKYLKKVVRLSFDILARKCVGNSKVVPS